MAYNSPHPIPGLPIRPPLVPALPGQVIIQYEILEPDYGCCKCEDMNAIGFLSIILLVLIFWPLAFIPCLIPECYNRKQRPVYGYPPSAHPPTGATGTTAHQHGGIYIPPPAQPTYSYPPPTTGYPVPGQMPGHHQYPDVGQAQGDYGAPPQGYPGHPPPHGYPQQAAVVPS